MVEVVPVVAVVAVVAVVDVAVVGTCVVGTCVVGTGVVGTLRAHPRQLDDKPGTPLLASLDEHAPVVDGDMALHDGQAEPHPRGCTDPPAGEPL
jgi:hypothetical protein